ncbi:hypothetical protein AMATHDRAFT_39385 [Amanita thiersii Skay4041]|uniref:Uncharacterized protein n=1 Tax=Amanita thiersii Skay4041 TaxID=703135 RepID=A0A2A9NXP7_9AGAR|nr:hypothetical protein AMATHDRAFT_39385 [Amanita thiersii Skay4041]
MASASNSGRLFEPLLDNPLHVMTNLQHLSINSHLHEQSSDDSNILNRRSILKTPSHPSPSLGNNRQHVRWREPLAAVRVFLTEDQALLLDNHQSTPAQQPKPLENVLPKLSVSQPSSLSHDPNTSSPNSNSTQVQNVQYYCPPFGEVMASPGHSGDSIVEQLTWLNLQPLITARGLNMDSQEASPRISLATESYLSGASSSTGEVVAASSMHHEADLIEEPTISVLSHIPLRLVNQPLVIQIRLSQPHPPPQNLDESMEFHTNTFQMASAEEITSSSDSDAKLYPKPSKWGSSSSIHLKPGLKRGSSQLDSENDESTLTSFYPQKKSQKTPPPLPTRREPKEVNKGVRLKSGVTHNVVSSIHDKRAATRQLSRRTDSVPRGVAKQRQVFHNRPSELGKVGSLDKFMVVNWTNRLNNLLYMLNNGKYKQQEHKELLDLMTTIELHKDHPSLTPQILIFARLIKPLMQLAEQDVIKESLGVVASEIVEYWKVKWGGRV